MDPLPLSHRRLKVLFAVTEDWYFWSHRKPLAGLLLESGCDVSIATRFNRHESQLRAQGFACDAVPFERSLRHPLRDLRSLFRLWSIVRQRQPDVVHLVSLKPILLSILALTMHRRTHFVAAVTGMGYLFSSQDHAAKLVKHALLVLLRWVLLRKNVWIIVQNRDDQSLLAVHRLGRSERTTLIPGVGVDLEQFNCDAAEVVAAPIVVLPARLIRDKGIEEFVQAARLTKREIPNTRFVLAGAEDPDNPAALAKDAIDKWVREGLVEWWGHRNDMVEVYRQATIVCLPSYREGFPKVLLEASACRRPLVATDVPGCREICRNGINGILVPARDSMELANALICLIRDPDLCTRYAEAGRRIVESEFALTRIAEQTLDFYRQFCDSAK